MKASTANTATAATPPIDPPMAAPLLVREPEEDELLPADELELLDGVETGEELDGEEVEVGASGSVLYDAQ